MFCWLFGAVSGRQKAVAAREHSSLGFSSAVPFSSTMRSRGTVAARAQHPTKQAQRAADAAKQVLISKLTNCIWEIRFDKAAWFGGEASVRAHQACRASRGLCQAGI